MNGAAVKAGVVALLASPLDDMAVAALFGRTLAQQFGPAVMVVGIAVALAGWWVLR